MTVTLKIGSLHEIIAHLTVLLLLLTGHDINSKLRDMTSAQYVVTCIVWPPTSKLKHILNKEGSIKFQMYGHQVSNTRWLWMFDCLEVRNSIAFFPGVCCTKKSWTCFSFFWCEVVFSLFWYEVVLGNTCLGCLVAWSRIGKSLLFVLSDEEMLRHVFRCFFSKVILGSMFRLLCNAKEYWVMPSYSFCSVR